MMIFRREAVYPGHPLVVATFILSKYGSELERAFVSNQFGNVAALADPDIPGAGDCVMSALDLLRSIMEGEATPLQAIEAAKKKWSYERTNCGHADSLRAGEWQAAQLEPEFLELLQKVVFDCDPPDACTMGDAGFTPPWLMTAQER